MMNQAAAVETDGLTRRFGGAGRERIDRTLAIVRLEADVHRLVREYSLGMRQRLGLDPAGIHQMRHLLRGHDVTVFRARVSGATMLLRVIAGEYGWKSRSASTRTTVPVDAAKLSDYAGRYDTPQGVLEVRTGGGKLYVSAPSVSGGRWELLAIGEDRFLLAEENEEITFVRGASREVTELRSNGGGAQPFRAPRLPLQ